MAQQFDVVLNIQLQHEEQIMRSIQVCGEWEDIVTDLKISLTDRNKSQDLKKTATQTQTSRLTTKQIHRQQTHKTPPKTPQRPKKTQPKTIAHKPSPNQTSGLDLNEENKSLWSVFC